MQIFFIRHGKTQWNLERRLQGQNGDSPLLDASYVEMERIHDQLKPINFDRVLTSPQPRAIKTLERLTDLPYNTDSRLSEWNFGEVEGMEIVEAVARYPQEMYDSRNALDRFDGSVFGAESVDSVLARFDSLLAELRTNRRERVLLIGHGASGTAGLRHWLGYDKSQLRAVGGIDNLRLTLLETAENRQIICQKWNEEI